MAGARGWWPVGVMVFGLTVVNIASNRVAPDAWYVPLAVLSAGALVWFAVRVDGRTLAELGMARAQVGRGLRWGAVLAGTVLALYLVALVFPATRDLFRDDRVEGWSFGRTAYAAFVRVPLGTVLLEEVAFRAVLPALLLARTRAWVAVAVSAGLFGLWHVLPALGLETVNPVASDTVGQLPGWITVVAAVVSTSAVGVWFLFLRHRSGSVLAPMALHWATNGLGYLFAWFVWTH